MSIASTLSIDDHTSLVVRYARFHTGVYVPSVGELGTVFPPQKTLDDLEMHYNSKDLVIKFKFRNIKHHLLIPSGNIAVISAVVNNND
jgi:hypothetical protein